VKKFFALLGFTIANFTLVFLISSAISFLQMWVSAAISIPSDSYIELYKLFDKIRWTIPLSFYVTILFSMNHALRIKVHPALSFLCVGVLSCGFVFSAFSFYNVTLPPVNVESKTLGSAGLMLSNGTTVFVLLDKPDLDTGSRVLATKGEPLVLQTSDESDSFVHLPPPPFSQNSNRLFDDLWLDFSFSAQNIYKHFESGLNSFLIWIVPLAVILICLSFMFNVGVWPLANLFLCAIFFRLVLLLEVFINRDYVQEFLKEFSKGAISANFMSPLVFSILATLLLAYVVLMHFAEEKGKNARSKK
jgi:hypothetical protein